MSAATNPYRSWRVWSLFLVLLLFATLTAVKVAFAGLPPANLSRTPGQSIKAVQTSPTPTATCSPGWTIYPNPAPAGDSVLSGITAIGANDLWAVGAYTATGAISETTLTVHGNGTSWTYVPSPNSPYSKTVLHAVAGVASNDVWAVGEDNGGQYGAWQTFTMHWDGTAWTIVPSPSDAFSPNHLNAVVAISSNNVWAVGRVGDTDFPHVYALIEHWDGASWSIVPNAGGCCGTPLYGVAALSANDVWAVGGGYPGGYSTYGRAYIEHWNGTAWSTVTNPAVGGTSLHAVAAVASNDVWAVGDSGIQTLIEHWDGTQWSIVSSPNPGASVNQLYGVSARAANDVWAVGDTNQASGGVKTLALRWNGSGWYQQATPDSAAGHDHFYAVVAMPSGVVWAVGDLGCTSGCNQNALIARAVASCTTPVPTWTPTATNTATPSCGLDWRGVSGPGLNGGWLNAVSVVSANDIWAVGAYYPNGYIQALIEHWDGSQWSIVPYDPNPGGTSYASTMVAVASNDVWAVVTGGYIHWNGSNWMPVARPVSGYVLGMSALASNNVWAVGYQEGSNQSTTLTEHWDGSSWSIVPSPNPTTAYNDLEGVAALAANNIWAVGRSYNGTTWLTLTEHWNGTQWSIVSSPGIGELTSVSAIAANDVWAVGCSNYECNGIGAQTLTEHWDGSSWSIVPSPNPIAGENNQLLGVAAVASNDVWAVGWSSPYSNPGQTLIEHWNGTQWSAVPNPPVGTSFYAVAAVAANNIWAVGGIIAHYNNPCTGSVTPTSTTSPTATCTVPVPGTPGPWAVRANYPLMLTDIAVASDGTNVYAFGGRNGSGRHTQSYKYDYASDSWSAIASFPYDALGEAEAEYGHNGKIYVIWGNGTYIYDIATDSWSLGASLPQSDLSFGHAYWNGKIYVIGGYVTGPINAVYAYNIATDSWSTLASLPQPEGLVASAAINGKIYVANGQLGGTGVTNNLYIYDIATNTWTDGASSPLASAAPGSTAVDGKLYMIGGGPQNGVVTATTYLYDPASNSWSQGPSLNVARKGGNAAVINTPSGQTSIVVGGVSGVDWLNSVEASTAPGVPCATATGTPPPNTATPTSTSTSTRTPTVPPTQTPGGPSATSVSTSTPAITPALTNTAVLSTGTPVPTACTISFTDVPPGSPFYPFVHCLACSGIVNGYPDGTFKPSIEVTRGQLSKIVSNAAGYNEPEPDQMFQDVLPVGPGSTFFVYINRLASRGYISGYPCGQPGERCVPPANLPYFRPNANATRGQISKIVANAAGFSDPPAGQQFQDVPIGSTFYTYTYRLVTRGVMSGYPCGSPPAGPCIPPGNLPYFRPYNNATRGQTSKIVANTFFPDCNPPER